MISNGELRERLRKHVDVLAELIGERNTAHPHGLDAARTYLDRELREMGHDVVWQRYPVRTREAINLVVALKGRSQRRGVLVIGAHYDSAPGTPGADDNASAVAVLLEIARSMAGRSPARDVELVFYDCEESPHFATGEMGSQHHARELRRAGRRVMGMICLESLGYFTRSVPEPAGEPWIVRKLIRWAGGRHVVIVSDLRSVWFGLRVVWCFATSGTFPFVPAALPPSRYGTITLSDHRGYWEQDMRALMITDTTFMRNPNYHSKGDRLATLDLDRMTKLCGQLQRAIRRLVRAR